MTKVLKDFPDFNPVEYASNGNAILGIRDSGKTVTATGRAEKLIEAGIPIIAIDPIGVWRFLRVPGKGPGYPVVVAGGIEGDLPLTDKNAEAIVRAAMQNRVSLVLDLYSMQMAKAEWRRIVMATLQVLLYENKEYGLRHIFIEEAAEFCPQVVGPEVGKVYDLVERLARMGGNAQLGYTLVNQRAEQVNKAVLELCDSLMLHRQKGKNSLTSLTKWLAIAGTKGDAKAIIDSLPTLPQGRCWAWMSGKDQPVQIQVPMKNSYHPDRRAMHGTSTDGENNREPDPVDVAVFVDAMKDTLAKAEPKKAPASPAARDLERLANNADVLQAYDKAAIAAAREEGFQHGQAHGYREGHVAGRSEAVEIATTLLKDVLPEIVADISRRLDVVTIAIGTAAPAPRHGGARHRSIPVIKAQTTGMRRTEKVVHTTDSGAELEADLRPMLATLVEMFPLQLTWSQLCTLLKIKARGGSFNSKRKRLLEQGWLAEQNSRLELQDQVWRVFERRGTPVNPIEHFLSVLPQPAADILRLLVDDGPHMPVAIAQRLGRSAVGGSWNTAISTLRANGLIVKRGDGGLEAVETPQ